VILGGARVSCQVVSYLQRACCPAQALSGQFDFKREGADRCFQTACHVRVRTGGKLWPQAVTHGRAKPSPTWAHAGHSPRAKRTPKQ
jgi:hypothetical protein